MWRRFFHLDELGTNARTEARAGVVTFMAMAYIIFVQPVILREAGMEDMGAVMMATCISSALATLLMGLLANYPIALAPAMGTNVFFAITVCGKMGVPWQKALGAVCISGLLFVLLAAVGVREKVMNAVPGCLKVGIAVGIGLLIAVVGMEHSGLAVYDPATRVTLGRLDQPHVLLALGTLALASILIVCRVRGAFLIAIAAATGAAVLAGIVRLPPDGVLVKAPPSMRSTLFKLDLWGALTDWRMLGVIFVFFFLDLFDTVGTLIGVGLQSGLMVDGRLPRARRALLSDAIGTVAGALMGTSTVTSYIESTAGVNEGGRSGLANLFTAGLFLAAMFFAPVVMMVGGGVLVEEVWLVNAVNPETGEVVKQFLTTRVPYYPITGPILILIGSFMLRSVTQVNFGDPSEFIPAFLTILIMPLAFSITDGISFGFISYALLKLVSGRGREVHWLVYLFGGLFVIRYVVELCMG